MSKHMVCKATHDYTIGIVRQMYIQTAREADEHKKVLETLEKHEAAYSSASATDQRRFNMAYSLACEKDAIVELGKRSEILLDCMDKLEKMAY